MISKPRPGCRRTDSEVAIVDLKMPKVDGISLISFIREMNPTLPVVVFTGVGYEEEQMHAALHADANGYVSKNLRSNGFTVCSRASLPPPATQAQRYVNGQHSALARTA